MGLNSLTYITVGSKTSVFGWQTFPDLRLTYGRQLNMSPRSGYSVHYGSTNQANSAFHPIGVGEWVVIHVITWFSRVETIEQQTWVRAAVCCKVWPKVSPTGYTVKSRL